MAPPHKSTWVLLWRGAMPGEHTSGENFFDDLSTHVGEPEIAALETVGQAFVVDPQAVQNSRLEIVDVDGVLDDVVAVVVGFPVA